MYYGKIVEMADSDELFKNPIHPYTKSLLSAIPIPDPNYERRRKRKSYIQIFRGWHDYSKEQPRLYEEYAGHFVSCNTGKELAKYQEQIKGDDGKAATGA